MCYLCSGFDEGSKEGPETQDNTHFDSYGNHLCRTGILLLNCFPSADITESI